MFHTAPDYRVANPAERDCIICTGSVGRCKTGAVDACASADGGTRARSVRTSSRSLEDAAWLPVLVDA